MQRSLIGGLGIANIFWILDDFNVVKRFKAFLDGAGVAVVYHNELIGNRRMQDNAFKTSPGHFWSVHRDDNDGNGGPLNHGGVDGTSRGFVGCHWYRIPV